MTFVILRHGESYSNLQRKYSGWYDTDLTDKGIQEAYNAAKIIKDSGLQFDCFYTSTLKRAIRTLWITMDVIDQMHVDYTASWRLNECHYGGFVGLNKEGIIENYGEEVIEKWKTSFDLVPPLVPIDSEYNPANDKKYSNLDPTSLPRGESLRMMWNRVYPIWVDEIAPQLRKGKKIMLVGHGNIMRGFIKMIEKLSDDEVMQMNVMPNGFPLVYTLDKDLNVVEKHLMGDPEEAKRSIYLSDGIV